MAKTDNLKDFLTDVADAIREKKGTTDLINPQDFSAEIASIKSGGGGVVAVSPKAVNFRDYDGTILHSYTKEEFLALTELPPLPAREGLICQEWNFEFADAVEYVAEYGRLEVGATYITDDGKTRLYITIAAEGRMDVPLRFAQTVANGVTIDWGDGSEMQTLSGTGNVSTTHHYNAVGDYVISLDVANDCKLGLGHGSSSYCIMGSTKEAGRVYCNMLRKVEIGKGSSPSGYAFAYCYSLSSVMIPKGITSIPNNSFYSCSTLFSVVIPKSVTQMGIYAFGGCNSLSSVVINLSDISDNAFTGCYSLSSVMIPKGRAMLPANLFQSCYSLSSVVIPKSVTYIGSNVFYGCYGMAFYDFSTLNSIPTLSSDSLRDIPSSCKIIVPDDLYDSWIAATNWSKYASQIIKKSDWDAQNA